MKNDNQIQIRIDTKTKNEAKKVLEKIGLDISSAVKIMLKKTIQYQNFPLQIGGEEEYPEKEYSKEFMDELEEISKETENAKRYDNIEDLIKALNS